MNKKRIIRILLISFLIIFTLIFLLPIVFVIFTSLKSNSELLRRPFYAFPEKIHLLNFIDAWKQGRMGIYIKNSLIISVIKVPLGIFIEACAAFALARMNFKPKNFLFAFFLVGMMIPFQATLVPLNIILNKFHLVNTYQGIIFVYIGFGIPFGILILRGFFVSIPKELDEAAIIDGCGDFQRFYLIILPLAIPAISALIILDFLATWNEFILAQIFITKDLMKTITTGLVAFQGQFVRYNNLLNAAVLIAILPVLLVYIAFQKYFTSGITGAIKG